MTGRAEPQPRAVVMADVARLAGVSQQTVSRVLNDSPHVRPATRERVLDAIGKLGYRPNRLARALVTGRSRTLGVLSFDTTLYGPASTLFAIERAAHEAGYFVSIASLRAPDAGSLRGGVERLLESGVEGVMVIAPQESAARGLLELPADVPVVATEAAPAGDVPLVAVDQRGGARLATEHLLALGHETVWHVAGPDGWLEAADRVRGWRAALQAAGAPVPPPLTGDWSARSGYAAGRGLANATAVFAANDQMALGVLRALYELGRRVPDDISVVGFDDIPEAAYFSPPLTTVRQRFDEIGARALRLLLARIENGAGRTGEAVRPELIIRASTAAR
jgi:DNA-binding LacI/PurR family transcriptional regulator